MAWRNPWRPDGGSWMVSAGPSHDFNAIHRLLLILYKRFGENFSSSPLENLLHHVFWFLSIIHSFDTLFVGDMQRIYNALLVCLNQLSLPGLPFFETSRVKSDDLVEAGPSSIEAIGEDALWLTFCNLRSHYILNVVFLPEVMFWWLTHVVHGNNDCLLWHFLCAEIILHYATTFITDLPGLRVADSFEIVYDACRAFVPFHFIKSLRVAFWWSIFIVTKLVYLGTGERMMWKLEEEVVGLVNSSFFRRLEREVWVQRRPTGFRLDHLSQTKLCGHSFLSCCVFKACFFWHGVE